MKGSSVKTLHDYIDELDRIRNFSHDGTPEIAEMQERIMKRKMRQLFTREQLMEYNIFFDDDF
jgi:hypothetical protein